MRDFLWSFKVEKAIKELNLLDYDIYHFEWGLDFYRNCCFVERLKELNKKIIFFVAIILMIELSGHGILSSIFRLLNSIN